MLRVMDACALWLTRRWLYRRYYCQVSYNTMAQSEVDIPLPACAEFVGANGHPQTLTTLRSTHAHQPLAARRKIQQVGFAISPRSSASPAYTQYRKPLTEDGSR